MKQVLKVIELFGGIGACTQGLKRCGIQFEVVDYVEIDKYAVKSYNAINCTDFAPQDITMYDKDIKADFIMHGSPCQDFSVAGKNAGGDEGSGTRSSLMYETIRIVEKLKPKYVVWENVKNLLSKKHKPNFDRYIAVMDELGYNSYYQVLNAKHYGIPQNRERVFTISIRKDIDTKKFKFPQPAPLIIRLKDVLESKVDEKFYIKKYDSLTTVNENYQMINGGVIGKMHDQSRRCYNPEYVAPTIHCCGGGNLEPKIFENTPINTNDGVCRTIKAQYFKNLLVNFLRSDSFGATGVATQIAEPFIVASRGRNPENPSDRTTGAPTTQRLEPKFDGATNTITSVQKDNYVVEPQVMRPERTEYGKAIRKQYESGEVKESRHNMTELKPRNDGISNTITTVQKDNLLQEPTCFRLVDKNGNVTNETIKTTDIPTSVRIRKLTPKECWRLMGFSDDCFEKAKAVNSNTQLYKQAGNSIVVDVLCAIFEKLKQAQGDLL